jgi:hypothetical protein
MASPARRTVEDAIKPEPRTTSTTALPFADASRVTPEQRESPWLGHLD